MNKFIQFTSPQPVSIRPVLIFWFSRHVKSYCNVLDFSTLAVPGDIYELWSSSLHNVLISPHYLSQVQVFLFRRIPTLSVIGADFSFQTFAVHVLLPKLMMYSLSQAVNISSVSQKISYFKDVWIFIIMFIKAQFWTLLCASFFILRLRTLFLLTP